MITQISTLRHADPPPHPIDNELRFPLRLTLAGLLILGGLFVVGGTGLSLLAAEIQLPGYTLEEPGLTPAPVETLPLWLGLLAGAVWALTGWQLWRNRFIPTLVLGLVAVALTVPSLW